MFSADSNVNLLKIRNLKVRYRQGKFLIEALNGIDLEVIKGRITAIIGESGSGKTTLAHAILRILPDNAEIVGGSILFKEKELLKLSEREMEKIRGREISMIFQEPISHLNPVMTVKEHLIETLKLLKGLDKDRAMKEALELLKALKIPDPEKVINYYPHQLSGGMAQRILIALSIAAKPSLLIADEPTSALDPTIQTQILKLLRVLNRNLGITILLITHDLSVVSAIADYIYVMYAGKICEDGIISEILTKPRHPYTQVLLASTLSVGKRGGQKSLKVLERTSSQTFNSVTGCKFYPMCPYAKEICKKEEPPPKSIEGSTVYCFLY